MGWLNRLTHNWTLKLAALGLAVLLWASIRAETLVRRSVPGVPVQVRVDDPEWTVARAASPDSVTVVFVGPWRELFRLALDRPRIVLPVDEVRTPVVSRRLQAGMLRVHGDLGRTRVEEFRPAAVRLHLERLTTRSVPVAVRTAGAVPEGYELVQRPHLDPRTVRVSGPVRRLEAIDSVRIVPIDLSRVTAPATVEARIDTTRLRGLGVSPATVDVFVPVVPAVRAPAPDSAAPPDTAAATGAEG